MQHLLNEPIEASELSEEKYHLCGDEVKLCFFYHKGVAVGHGVELMVHYHTVKGFVSMCQYLDENLFKVEILFVDKVEAFKVRMLEQAARIESYQNENSHLSLEEAANEWVELNGAIFPEK